MIILKNNIKYILNDLSGQVTEDIFPFHYGEQVFLVPHLLLLPLSPSLLLYPTFLYLLLLFFFVIHLLSFSLSLSVQYFCHPVSVYLTIAFFPCPIPPLLPLLNTPFHHSQSINSFFSYWFH